MKLVENRSGKRNTPLNKTEAAIAGVKAPASVRDYLRAFPIYAATPLVSLPGLAASFGVAAVDIKDEGQR